MNQVAEDYHGKDNVERATQEVIAQFGLAYEEAKPMAIKALDGLESHGFGAEDFEAVKETIRVVVASWLAREPKQK